MLKSNHVCVGGFSNKFRRNKELWELKPVFCLTKSEFSPVNQPLVGTMVTPSPIIFASLKKKQSMNLTLMLCGEKCKTSRDGASETLNDLLSFPMLLFV